MISDVMHDEILKTLVSRPKTSHIVLQFHTAKCEHNLYVDNPCMVCVLVTCMMYVLPKHYLVNMPCLAGYETPHLNPPVWDLTVWQSEGLSPVIFWFVSTNLVHSRYSLIDMIHIYIYMLMKVVCTYNIDNIFKFHLWTKYILHLFQLTSFTQQNPTLPLKTSAPRPEVTGWTWGNSNPNFLWTDSGNRSP